MSRILLGLKKAGAGSVVLALRDSTSPMELFAKDEDGGPLYAILMPMHLVMDVERWRPGQVEPDPALVEQARNEAAASALALVAGDEAEDLVE